VLAFGGDNGNTPYGSTWEWDGSVWSLLTPTTSPPARGGAAMAPDGAGGLILYGGYSDYSGSTPLFDTWRWNGSNWAHLTPVHVPDVQAPRMAYDSVQDQLVLVPGNASTIATWVWDGSDWTQPTVLHPPKGTNSPSLAYDVASDQLVLFGGYDTSLQARTHETYTWDGSDWTHRTPLGQPPVRQAAGMAYDPTLEKLVLFGGNDESTFHLASDTWTWDGQTWNQETTSIQPEARSGPSTATVPGGVLLYGGNSASALHDTWSWGYIDTTPPTVTLTAPASAFTLGTTVRVSYTGHDDVAVTGYDVRWRRAPYDGGFGSWRPRPAGRTRRRRREPCPGWRQATSTASPPVPGTRPGTSARGRWAAASPGRSTTSSWPGPRRGPGTRTSASTCPPTPRPPSRAPR
jgi:hypothetical protein